MRHPFDGIIVPEERHPAEVTVAATPAAAGIAVEQKADASRRTFLQSVGSLLAIAGGALGWTRSAFAQQETRDQNQRGRTPPPDQRYTTQALGEEGGDNRGRDRYTTQALGEEGGDDRGRDRYTTQALGEEGGRGREPDRYTTYALGEEGGRDDRGRGRYTTYALGEEGSSRDDSYRRRPPPPPPQRDPYEWSWGGWSWRGDWQSPPRRGRYTTQALGEEGGWW